MSDYEVVIGLELHAHLKTKSKLFCGCSTEFGASPNSHTCPVCLGMPGVLPVMNRRAFDLALKAALALNCKVAPITVFDRKNYYYPDLPKNYQISQNYHNLGVDGYVDIEVEGEIRRVGIDNVHLEEDAGKLMHPEDTGSERSQVDLNRTGTPLLEIVTKPDMRSVAEARAYMDTMRQVLSYLDVSDCKMQEGSLRFEASISLRHFGQKELGNRVEIKNVNSVRFVLEALEYEIHRQSSLLDKGETVAQETALYDEVRGETRPMRTKEHAHDYRYFPDPDLVPVHIPSAKMGEIRASIPELPLARKRRFVEAMGIPEYDAGVLVDSPGLADYFEACCERHSDAKAVSNLLLNDLLRVMNEQDLAIERFPVPPEASADLLDRVAAGEISKNVAREVFVEMVQTGKEAGAIIQEKGLEQIGNEDELLALVKQALAQNEKAVADYRSGNKKAKGALMGPVMRATRGKADPQKVNQLIDQLILQS